MNLAKALLELEKTLLPYMFFWEEWAADKYCTLTTHEVATINFYIKWNFRVNAVDSLMQQAEADEIYFLIRKLELGYSVFRCSAVVTFHSLLSDFANKNPEGRLKFLATPIRDLAIPENTKLCLQAFKVETIGLIFTLYKPIDFQMDKSFKTITEFLIANRKRVHQTI